MNLYIPSELDWPDVGLVLRQEGDITRGEAVRFSFPKTEEQTSPLNFRVPHWIRLTPADR